MNYRFIFYKLILLALVALGYGLAPDLSDEFISSYGLWRDPVLAGAVCGFTLSLLGVYILLNRIVFVSLSVAQGAGLGIFTLFWACSLIGYHLDHSVLPLLSGLSFAAFFTFLFVYFRGRRHVSEESLIGLLYVISSGMILVIGDWIPQGKHDIESLLFGNAVAITTLDLKIVVSVLGLIILLQFSFRREFLFVSADATFMKSRGMKIQFWNGLLFFLFAVGITVSLKTLGILPVFALILIPPFIGLKNAKSLGSAFGVSLLIGTAMPILGYYYSYVFSLPTGASVILVGLGILTLSVLERGLIRTS